MGNPYHVACLAFEAAYSRVGLFQTRKDIIEGVTVEGVNEYTYLGTVLDNQLAFECNTNNIVKTCHQRMFSKFRLRTFGVSRKTLHIFYCSFIESVLTSCLNCLLVWYFWQRKQTLSSQSNSSLKLKSNYL